MTAARIHHFGRVVGNIEKFLDGSLWELRGEIIEDPLQRARLCMVGLTGDTSVPLVELIEPAGQDSPTYRAADKGGGWHHVCLSFPTTADADKLVRAQRLLPVTEWKPAVLFGKRPVRFVYSRQRELIELIGDEVQE